ncbi:hypothetical protein HDU96_003960, partial [Phlyctochytrium bullatum]
TEADRLDRFYWGNKDRTTTKYDSRGSYKASGRGDDMQIDNIETGKRFRKLTPEEKIEYRRTNRCTFCRETGHTIENCKHPLKKPFKPRINNVEAETETDPELVNSEDERSESE